MPFSATVNLGTVGVAITSVKLYGCTGNSGGNCTGCTALTGYENVSVSTFPLLVSGIPNGITYIQAEALGACSADAVKQCISISGIPGPTPVPTSTLPPATPNATPLPTATTPGATPVPTPTQTVGSCTAPTLNSVTLVGGSTFTLNYTSPSVNCTALTLSRSRDQITWTDSTGGCTTGRQLDTLAANGTWYFRLTQICGGVTSNSNIVSYTYTAPGPTPTQTLGLTNCVRLTKDDAITGTENCNLDRVQRHEVTLYDASGANIQTAPYDITVTLTGTSGGTSTTWTFIIPSGSTSVYEDIIITEYTGVCGERDGRIAIFISGISEVSPTNIGVCASVPAPTAGATLNPFYYGQGLSTPGAHCGTNYLINSPFYSTATTLSGLMNQYMYTTNEGITEFNGLSQWYPVALTSVTNTLSGQYWVILINSNGYVEDIKFIDSQCDENTQ